MYMAIFKIIYQKLLFCRQSKAQKSFFMLTVMNKFTGIFRMCFKQIKHKVIEREFQACNHKYL